MHEQYLENFEMECWWNVEKISWTDRVRKKEVLHTAHEEKNILDTTERKKAKYSVDILRRTSLLKHNI
jgi:hypothetical protein